MSSDDRQTGSDAGRMAGLLARGLWQLLKPALGPSVHVALWCGLGAFLVIVIVLGSWQRTRDDTEGQAAAQAAATAMMPPAVSFDKGELQHEIPWTVVAVVVREAAQEDRMVSATEVAGQLAPLFSYQEYALRHRVVAEVLYGPGAGSVVPDLSAGAMNESVSAQLYQDYESSHQVKALTLAATYKGDFHYNYRIVRQTTPDGWEEVLEHSSMTFVPDLGRFRSALQSIFARVVLDGDLQWLLHTATDLESTDPGRWLFDDDPEAVGGPVPENWNSTWSGTPSGGKVVPLGGPLQITSEFGRRVDPVTGADSFHTGVDLAADTGTPIHSAWAGRVEYAGWLGNYGQAVLVDHGLGVVSLYGHQSRTLVHVGDIVTAGQVIGEVGSTGKSTGPHLHFEVRKDGQAVNPLAWLQESISGGQ